MLRSVDHPDVAAQYAVAQQAILKQFGVSGVTSAQQAWQSDPNTYMFIAKDELTGEMVAGMRLDKESDNKTIPMSEALTAVSAEFRDVVDNLKPLGVAEGCGWWVKEGYSGLGLPGILLRAGVSVSPYLGINYIVGFPHQHTKPIMSKFGFIAVDVIGDNGSFIYPDDRYRSTVVELNTRTLHTTPRAERERMLALRNNLTLKTEECGLTLQFSLKLQHNYRAIVAIETMVKKSFNKAHNLLLNAGHTLAREIHPIVNSCRETADRLLHSLITWQLYTRVFPGRDSKK